MKVIKMEVWCINCGHMQEVDAQEETTECKKCKLPWNVTIKSKGE